MTLVPVMALIVAWTMTIAMTIPLTLTFTWAGALTLVKIRTIARPFHAMARNVAFH